MSETPPPQPPRRRVLFLCTANSARSILAECLLRRHGHGRVEAHSAGSRPRGSVHPRALELLRTEGHATESLRSKSQDEFVRAGAPALDLVITVCANAAGEACPVWPGDPPTLHWDIDDPAAIVGSEEEERRAFRAAYAELERRIRALLGG